MPDPEPPSQLGRYRLRFRVAQGGMASVYLAQLEAAGGFEKWIAIKTIHAHIAKEPRFVEMFRDEARLAAKLDHPHICTIFDFGEAAGTPYIAMEYLHGVSLDQLARRGVREGGVPPRIAARIVSDAARGLHYAHELRTDDGEPARVVHRDVSPQNVFVLYSGVTKVVDFGIARSAERLAEETRTGESKGKLAYMSPEQLSAPKTVDRRTDVWALGVVLWEIILGKRLFKRDNPGATITAVLQGPVAPTSVEPSFPPALETIVMRALSPTVGDRYASAIELSRDLERFIGAEGEPCTPEDVGRYVTERFGEEKAEREKMLSAAGATSREPTVLESPSETSLRDLESVRPPAPAPPPPPPPPRAAPRRGVPMAVMVIAVLVALAGGAATVFLLDPAGLREPIGADDVPASAGGPGAAGPSSDERPDDEAAAAAEPEREARATDVAPAAAVAAGAPGPDEPGTEATGSEATETEATETEATETEATETEATDTEATETAATDTEATETAATETAATETEATETSGRRAHRAGGRSRRGRARSGGGGVLPEGVGGADAFGFLHLTSNPPGLQVFAGSRSLGRTPLQSRLPVGSHSIRLVDAQGDSHRFPVRIDAYATSVMNVDAR